MAISWILTHGAAARFALGAPAAPTAQRATRGNLQRLHAKLTGGIVTGAGLA